MYIVDFLKRIKRKSNIPVFIYLLLNLIFIIFFVFIFFEKSKITVIEAILIAIAVYGISLTLALSPIGEYILRIQTGCKEIKRQDYKDYIFPIFYEVYEKAKKLDPTLPNDIKLYISSDQNPNAFATGRKTICLTEGLLDYPKDQVKAILAHEFGHLSNRDTDLILVVTVGNFIFTSIVWFIKFVILSISIIASFRSRNWGTAVTAFLTYISVTFLMMIWTKIGTMLVMKSARDNEYEADKFSYDLGYGNSLCSFLDNNRSGGAEGLFATLLSSHPESDYRIANLQSLGASYKSTRF